MSIISTKGIYGLNAINVLAKADNEALLNIKTIATKANIPQKYLEQILVVLKNNNIVESVRGAVGGYKLAKNKKDITVYEILHCLECCIDYVQKKDNSDILEPFWEHIHQEMKNILDLSILDLEEFLQKNSKNIHFDI